MPSNDRSQDASTTGDPSMVDPSRWGEHHDGRLAEMVHTAKLAGEHTLKYFGAADLVVDAKSDASPVTMADREAESLVRRRLGELFPDDEICGEEHDDTAGGSGYRWTVDPIDGTKSFICGVPLYSTLLALEWNDDPLGGVICLPAAKQMVVAAIGMGCYQRTGTSGWQTASCRTDRSLDGCVFVQSQVDAFAKRGGESIYKAIESRASITRSWGDGYGYAMVATGRADLMMDPECNAWDVAAILPIVREAGGVFTDWKGNATVRGGDGVGAGSAALHEEVMKVIAAG